MEDNINRQIKYRVYGYILLFNGKLDVRLYPIMRRVQILTFHLKNLT